MPGHLESHSLAAVGGSSGIAWCLMTHLEDRPRYCFQQGHCLGRSPGWWSSPGELSCPHHGPGTEGTYRRGAETQASPPHYCWPVEQETHAVSGWSYSWSVAILLGFKEANLWEVQQANATKSSPKSNSFLKGQNLIDIHFFFFFPTVVSQGLASASTTQNKSSNFRPMSISTLIFHCCCCC